MKFLMVILTLLVAGTFVGAARADDGVPTPPTGVAKPPNCQNISLGFSQDIGTGPGSQCVTGGEGSNAIGLYGGDDWADGRGGSDTIDGGSEHDVLYGGHEGDTLLGGPNNDTLLAGCPGGCDVSNRMFVDVLKGGDGDDILGAQNGEPNDQLRGGNGFDVCYGGRSDVFIDCEEVHKG